MKLVAKLSMVLLMLTAPLGWADEGKDAEAVENFRNAGTGNMIDSAYGYAVFPTIGKGGIGIGGAHGKGGVYRGVSALDSPACHRSLMVCSWVDSHTARSFFPG
jgi:hypothetical protein